MVSKTVEITGTSRFTSKQKRRILLIFILFFVGLILIFTIRPSQFAATPNRIDESKSHDFSIRTKEDFKYEWELNTHHHPGGYAFKIDEYMGRKTIIGFSDSSSEAEPTAITRFDSIEDGIVEFYWDIEWGLKKGEYIASLGKQNEDYIQIVVLRGVLGYRDYTGSFKTLRGFTLEQLKWVNIKIKFDCANNKFSMIIDDTYIYDGLLFYKLQNQDTHLGINYFKVLSTEQSINQRQYIDYMGVE
jgi:hypothetical protein